MKAGKVIKTSIWDNSGCAKFRSIITAYLRGAHGVVVMYDVTNVQSYLDVQEWLTDLDEQGKLIFIFIFVSREKFVLILF